MLTLDPPSIDLLESLDIFSGISREELEKISALMQRELYHPGEILIKEADIGTQFFVLIKGHLEVMKRIEGDVQEVLNVISKSGELFGEMALVENKPRSAAIIAKEESEVLVIPKEGFLELVNQFPQFTLEVAKSISNYLRQTDMTLIGALESKNRELVAIIEELKETRQALVDSERLSIIGRMASTILHDLKNPMTTIAGFAQLIGLKELPYEEIVKYTRIIAQQVNQFNSLAHELLTFARGGATLQLQTLDFPKCIDETLLRIRFNLTQQKMTLDTDLNNKARIDIDPNRFYRVFENLANNAIEAMEIGGTFSIKSFTHDNQLVIQLTDSGHGMEKDVQEKVFEEFFTHQKHNGTGLGLAIADSIIKDHKGEITVESVLNEGTTFTIKLPLSKN
ncbi:cyclic nucleotide-binding domain-containing protein [bacterium]|nr:cyclic nucleotide-binding domain-containing protein [bacterium]